MGPEVMSFGSRIFWSLEPTVAKVMSLAMWWDRSWVPLQWVTWTWGTFLIILRMPCTVSEPTGHVWSISGSVVTSTAQGGPGQKEEAEEAARGADKIRAWISHSACETWQVYVLEPGQSLGLIAMALPTLTLVFGEALTGLQHDECTHTLIL